MVEDWLHVTLEERKRLVASIFEVITLDDTGELDCTPRESWKDYARAVIPATTANESAHQGVLSGRRGSTARK